MAGTPVKSCRTTRAGHEGDFHFGRFGRVPFSQLLDVICGYDIAIAVSQRGFQQDADGKRQTRNGSDAHLFEAV